jgi:hypothetical protein
VDKLTHALPNSLSVVVSNVIIYPLTVSVCVLGRRRVLESREALSDVVVAQKAGKHCYLEGEPVF